jgi:predicted ATPase/DNA-binding SARP family transcriptional activator
LHASYVIMAEQQQQKERTMARLGLVLLGPLQATLDDQPVAGLTYAKVRTLLAYLAVESRPHSRDGLAELLWPNHPSAAARRSLRVALSTLRQALGDQGAAVPFLLATRESVQINPASAITIDLSTFGALIRTAQSHAHPGDTACADCAARLAEAVALYRGDFLHHLEVRDSPAFEEWVMLRRERLHRQALDALAALMAYHESHGDDDLARRHAWRMLALEPWDEAAHRCVMRVLARRGQRGAALAQYERCRQVLAAELGVEPSSATTTLYAQIRAGSAPQPVAAQLAEAAMQGRRASQPREPRDRPGPTAPREAPWPTPPTPPDGRGEAALAGGETITIALPPPIALAAPTSGNELAGHRAPRHNLPPQLTPLIGREAELAKLAKLLANPACRLVTLVGAGGSGKTRLALQAAWGQIGAHGHGVSFVALASISSPDFLVPAIADSLGFAFNGPQDPRVQLLNYLREKELLLILDNFEHLVAGAGILADILASAPSVKLLVTSRAGLKLYGEWVYQIQGLALPEANDLAHLEQSSAAQLFLQSARRAQSDFSPSEADKLAIVRLCRMVEGLPLGLELAASWVRVLSCEEIIQELAHSLDFLTTDADTLPARHRSIRAVFDHSWNLLSVEERRVFRRLSVFQGRFRREAAEYVAGTSLPLLAALLDKSLLRRRPDGCYEMHELIRQYATEKLADVPDEQETARDRHGRYFLELLQQQETQLKSNHQQQALETIREEIDNIRLACQRAITQKWASAMSQMTQSLWLFYDIQGWYHEAEALFRRAAESLSEPEAHGGSADLTSGSIEEHGSSERRERDLARGLVMAQQGWFLLHLGLIGKSRELFHHSEALLRRLGARAELAEHIQAASMAAWVAGDYREAQAILQEGLAIFSERQSKWGIALCFLCGGNVAALLGDYEEAKRLLRQSLALSKATGDPKLTALVLNYLGPVAHRLGSYTEAKQWLQESLSLSRAIGDRWSMLVCLNHLGAMAYQQGPAEWPEAKRLHQESLALAQLLGERREMAASLNYLGYVSGALAEYEAARHYFLAALQTAQAGQIAPVALDALVGLATLLLHRPSAEPAPGPVSADRAITLLELALSHPASSQEVKEKARSLLAEVANVSPQVMTAAQEPGRASALTEVVAAILAEAADV